MSELNDLVSERNSLRLELHTLRFKESEERRFIWWVREVYAKKVKDAILKIKGVCTTWNGMCSYELPAQCWEDLGRIMESTNGIYDGTYLDVEISTVVKTSTDNNKCWWTQESDPEVFPNLWRAGCGNSFWLDAEKPSDNHMKYCCYCGKEIAEG